MRDSVGAFALIPRSVETLPTTTSPFMIAATLAALGALQAPNSAMCFAMGFFLTLGNLGHFSDPAMVIPVVNDSGLVVQLSNLTCPSLNLGALGVHYNSTDMHVWVQDAMDIDCFLAIDILNATANFSLSTDLHFSVEAAVGQEVHIVAEPDLPLNSCLARNATLANMTLLPTISQLKLVPETGANAIIDLFVLPAVQKALTDEIHGVIFNLTTALTAQFNNNTVEAITPPPRLMPGATPISEWGLGKAVRNIVNNLPNIGGLRLDAEFLSETTIRLNLSLPDGAFVGAPSDATYFNIPAGFKLSVDIAFDYLICDDSRLNCVAANGIKLMNIRLTGAGEMDRLVDNAFGPLLETLVNGLIAGGADKDNGAVTINIPDDAQISTPPLWVTLVLGPALSIAASCCIAYSAYRHIIRPVLNSNGEKISFLRIFFEDSIVTATCFGCIYLFIWSNTTSAASVVVGNAIPVYNFALMNTVEDLWNAGLKPLSVLVFIFSGVYPYFKLLTIVTFSVVLQAPQSRTLRIVDNLGKFSLLDTFVMTILKTGLEINGIANVNAHPSFYVFLVATVLSILIGNYATHGWRRETTVWLVNKAELLIQEDSGEELSKKKQKQIIDGMTTEAYVERLSATVRRKKLEEQAAVKRKYSPSNSQQSSASTRIIPEYGNHLDVTDINRNTVRSPISSGDKSDNYGTTSSSSDVPNTVTHRVPANSRSISGDDSDITGLHIATDSQLRTELLPPSQFVNTDGPAVRKVLNCCLARNCFATPEDEELRAEDVSVWAKQLRAAWEWYLGLPCATIVAVASILSIVFNVLRYNISGIALLIVSDHKDLTMWDMFISCDWPLLLVGLWTVFIAPVIYIVTFPHFRSLAAWCATDAFLLACVAGLLQLQSFITFILGPAMVPVYSATCSLLWPLIPMFVGMLIQWFFIFKQMLNIEGVPTLQKIKDSYNSPTGASHH